MKKFVIDPRIIIKIVDEFSEKHNCLDKESYITFFSLLSDYMNITGKYRKKYKENHYFGKELYNENHAKNNADIINEKINIEESRIEINKTEKNEK